MERLEQVWFGAQILVALLGKLLKMLWLAVDIGNAVETLNLGRFRRVWNTSKMANLSIK